MENQKKGCLLLKMNKNTKIFKAERYQGLKIRLLVILFIGLFSMSFVSAFDFDNVKSYNSLTKTATINNCDLWTGICLITGEKIADVTLKTPQVFYVMQGKDRKVAEFEVDLNSESYKNFISKIDLINNKNSKTITRDIIYKYKTLIPYEIGVNDYKEECQLDIKNNTQVCSQVIIGTHKETKYNELWTSLDKLDLTKGKITIGLFTDVYAGDNVEWIPTLAGVKITEWATWTDGLTVGLVSYYKLDENAGTITNDSLGRNNGTIYNGNWNSGKINYAYNFTQNYSTTLSFINTTLSSQLAGVGGNNVTYTAWIKPTSCGSSLIIFSKFPGIQFGIYNVACKIGTYTETGGWKYTTNAIILNQWNFVAVAIDSGTAIYYINGGENGSASGLSWTTTNAAGVIGHNLQGDYGFKGIIDEIGIWNRSLSAGEISDLYNGGAGITYSAGAGPYSISVNLTLPLDNAVFSTTTINFNSTITPTNVNLTNATLYIWKSDNSIFNKTTNIITGNETNSTGWTINNFVIDSYKWNVFGCGKNSSLDAICSYAANNYTFSLGSIVNQTDYNSVTYETKQENFNVTIDLLEDSLISLAQLVYNGTNYTISDITGNSTRKMFSKTINIPLNINPFINETKQFFFRFIYGGTSTQTTSLTNQTVSYINFQICNSTYNTKYLNFTIKDEKTNININSSFSGIFNYYLGGGATYKNYSYSNISNLNYFYPFCFYPQDKTIKTNMVSEFEGTTYQTRTYYLTNASLTNVTNNINLYLLNDSDIIKFFFTLTKSLTPVTNAYVTISKYDLSTGTYNTIGIRKSDNTGKFIEYLELDKDYRFSIVKNSELLGVLDKNSICSATPCEMFLEITEEPVNLWQGYYDSFATNIAYNLTFNPATSMFTFDFIDLTGLANYFRLQVNKIEYNQTGALICNNFSYANSGTLICNVTGYEGNFMASAYVSRSPEKLIETIYGLINALKDIIGANEGLLFTFILVFLVALIGAWNPIVGIILATSTFFLSFIMGFVSVSYTTIILIFILAVIIILKTGREI